MQYSLLTQGATKILQLLQNGSFLFNRLSQGLYFKVTMFYCFKILLILEESVLEKAQTI